MKKTIKRIIIAARSIQQVFSEPCLLGGAKVFFSGSEGSTSIFVCSTAFVSTSVTFGASGGWALLFITVTLFMTGAGATG